MLNLEESEYALSKILEVLNSPWQPGINYDGLKSAADRHTKRIRELEAAQGEKKWLNVFRVERKLIQ